MQLNDLLPQVDLMSFIQDILDNIEKYKVDWITCRRCVFHTITNILSDPRLIYIGDASLGFQEGAVQSEISLNMRPGGKGLVAPGEAYIFSISHNESMKINFGSCIHRNLKPRSNVIGPKACEAQRFFIDQDDFSRCLLNSYLKGKESFFVPLNNLAHIGNSGSNTLFFQLPYLNKTVITFVPTTANAEQYFQSIVSRVAHLMPYTPSMVLLRNSDVGCAIGINFVDFNKPEAHIYFFDDNNYHPYPINETTLEYLFHNLGELTNPNNQTFIAITGEMLSIPFDEDSTINFDNYCLPKADDNCGCVFSNDRYYYSHLVIVTNKTIPNQEPLPWERKKIAAHDSKPNYTIKLANGLFPEFASVKHSKNRIFFIKSDKSITIQGTKPHIEDEYGRKEMTKHRQIDAMFDLFAMHCVENNRLCKNVDLKSFSGNGPTIDKTVILNSSKKDLFRNPITPEDFHSQDNSQGELKAANSQKYQLTIRKNELKRELDKSLTGLQKKAIFAEISSINTQLSKLCQRIEELKAQQPQEPRSETKLPVKVFKTFPNYQMACQLNKANLFITSLNENEIVLDVPINEANPQNQIQKLFEIAFPSQSPSSYIQEIVPFYDVHINHVSDSKQTQDEFTKAIEKVCSRFGGIISRISKYNPDMKKQFGIQGSINVQMYSDTFVIPLLTLISDELFGKERVVLKLPQSLQIDAYTITTFERCPEIMREWVRNHDLHISLVRNRWIAATQTDADRAIELFKTDPPTFPIRIIPIPGGVNMMKLINKLKSKHRDWKLNRMRRIIVVPAKAKESEIKKLFNLCSCTSYHNDDEEEEEGAEEFTHLGDILYCEENARLSKKRINIYTPHDATIKNFCVSCIKTSLANSLGRMFDEDSNRPNLIHILQNDDLMPEITLLENPANQFIPIGQLLVSFIHEHEIANLARTYITAIAYQSLRRSPFLTFCPNHPGIFQKKPAMHTRLRCSFSGCRYHLCPDCNKWHDSESCPAKIPIPKGYRICPYCGKVVEKIENCNRVTCICGKSFCYYCNAGPYNTSVECYQHLNDMHGNYYKDPPVYLKFVKGDNSITDEMLEDFYRQHPNIKNLHF